jgi:hypothetical protein
MTLLLVIGEPTIIEAMRRGTVAAIAVTIAGCGFKPADVGPDGPLPITVGFQFATSLADELVGTWQVQVVLSEPAPANITVEVAVVGGSAIAGMDFTMDTTQVLFDPGEMMQSIPIPIAMDADDDEDDETIELELRAPVRAVLGTDRHTVTISAEPLPRIHFTQPESTDGEAIGTVTMMLEMTAMSATDVQVEYALTGTASWPLQPTGYPADHDLMNPTTITIPAGSLTYPIVAAITPDVFDEFDETAIVTINGIAGVIAEGVVTRTHNIIDDDLEPVVGFSMQSGSADEPGPATVTVTLSEQSGKPITVDFTQVGVTAEPSDFTPNTLPVLFAPHAAPQTIVFTINDDSIDEDDETVDTTLTNAMNASLPAVALRTHTTAIVDEDPSPSLDFALSSGQTTETGAPTYLVTVTVTPPSPERVVGFNLGVAGTSTAAMPADFSFTGPFTVPLNTPSIDVPIAIVNDTADESDEVFTLTFKDLVAVVPGTVISHACSIIDDDPILIAFDPAESDTSEPEGGVGTTTMRSYRIIASAAPPAPVTITIDSDNGTATCGNSPAECTVMPAMMTTIPAGMTARTVQVIVRGDTAVEADETVIVTLTGASGGGAVLDALGTLTRTHTITNDDP